MRVSISIVTHRRMTCEPNDTPTIKCTPNHSTISETYTIILDAIYWNQSVYNSTQTMLMRLVQS